MTKHTGYSHTHNPSAEQVAQLAEGLMSGKLSRFFVEDGTAYYRRAHGEEFQLMDAVRQKAPENTPPIALDANLSITEAAEVITEFGKVCGRAGLSLDYATPCRPAASFRSEEVSLSKTRIRGTLARKKRPDRISMAEIYPLLFAAMGVGAIIAILTR